MVNTVTASGNNVVVTFKELRLTEFASDLTTSRSSPRRSGSLDKADDGSFLTSSHERCWLRPDMYKTAAQDRMVWVKNPAWWHPRRARGLRPHCRPTYVATSSTARNMPP